MKYIPGVPEFHQLIVQLESVSFCVNTFLSSAQLRRLKVYIIVNKTLQNSVCKDLNVVQDNVPGSSNINLTCFNTFFTLLFAWNIFIFKTLTC